MLRPEILHGLKTDQALLAHTPRWNGVSPEKKFDRENVKFGLKLGVLRSITSGLVGVLSRDFFQSTPRWAGVIIWVQFLQGQCQKFVTVKKSSKIFSDFWQLSILIANISGMDQRIKKWNNSWKSTTPPTLDEKKLVYFGPQTKKLLTLINVHPNGLFSGDYISALRGCCALKFYTG